MSLNGVIFPMVVEARLNPALILTHKGPARTMSELKNVAVSLYFKPTVAMHKYLSFCKKIFLYHLFNFVPC